MDEGVVSGTQPQGSIWENPAMTTRPPATISTSAPRLEGTKQAILDRLLGGERHVLAIAHELGIRESAIRRHFDQLDRMGFVEGFFRQEGLGRPKKYYALTPQGRERFPQAYVEPLERALRRITEAGRANTVEEAVPLLARDRVEAHRARFDTAGTPLSLARAVERVFTEVGIACRPRIQGNTILMDWTSSVVLRNALGRNGDFSSEWRHQLLDAVLDAAGRPTPFEVTMGQDLSPTATTVTA